MSILHTRSWLEGVFISFNAESMSVKQHPGMCAVKKKLHKKMNLLL